MSRDKRAQAKDALCALFRAFREEAGLRQVDLARRLRRPQSFVSKLESGERRLDVLELRAFSKALGLSLSELVTRIEGVLSDP